MASTASIEALVADGIVDEIVQRVKTGKEAEVFVVRKGADFLAAKVYKERTQRNFKNNVGYMEGRTVRNSRDMRAMQKRTGYGVAKAEEAWMLMEHDALVTAAAAGVRVPKAELFYEGVLLMELVLDPNGQPAPRLSELSFSPEEAVRHHRDVVSMIVKLLCCDLIHGDLSPYNVLLAWNGPTIIDLPQVVKAAHNSQAEPFLLRDVRNVTEFFARFAPELKQRAGDGHQIWRKYLRRELASDFFPEEGVAPPREPAPSRPPDRPRAPRPEGRSPVVPAQGRPQAAPPRGRAGPGVGRPPPSPSPGPRSEQRGAFASSPPSRPMGPPMSRPDQGPPRRPNIDTSRLVAAGPSLAGGPARPPPGPVASGQPAQARPPSRHPRAPRPEGVPVERVTRLGPPPRPRGR
ncbi:MAG: hypothetical protein RL199_2124 [Pseudomonadota bacterium]|jgi:RIO kinase 1